jgi:hypothetical protein
MMGFKKIKIGQPTPVNGPLLKNVVDGVVYPDGAMDLRIEVILPGTKLPELLPFTYRPSETGEIGPVEAQIAEWLAAHRRFKPTPVDFPAVTAAEVKLEAQRRIREIIPRFKVERAISGGKAISEEDQKAAQAVRDASNRIEKLNPIPADFREDWYWA